MLWGQKSTWGHLGSLGSNLVLCYIVFTCYSYIYAYALASTPLPIREHLAHLSDKGLQVKQKKKKMAPAGVVLFEHSMSSSSFFFLTLPAQRGRVLYCISFEIPSLLLLSFCQHANISKTLCPIDAHTWSQYQVCERALLT